MFYDYIITQFYPSIPYLVLLHIITFIAVLGIYFLRKDWLEDFGKGNQYNQFVKKWGNKVSLIASFQAFALIFYFWIPDVEYVKYFYGDVRVVEITPQQKAELQAQYDKHYEQSKQLLLDCLDKGQKQPHTTVYNDTNEVVKTCYDVAKYKF